MLQDLIKKLQELCSKAELVAKEYATARREYEQKKFGLSEQEKRQNAKDVELKAREEKVKHIEDVERLHKEATGILAKIDAEKGALAIDKVKHEERKKSDEEDIANRKALAKKSEEALADGVKKLEEDRKTYKKKVVREILSKGDVIKSVLDIEGMDE